MFKFISVRFPTLEMLVVAAARIPKMAGLKKLSVDHALGDFETALKSDVGSKIAVATEGLFSDMGPSSIGLSIGECYDSYAEILGDGILIRIYYEPNKRECPFCLSVHERNENDPMMTRLFGDILAATVFELGYPQAPVPISCGFASAVMARDALKYLVDQIPEMR